MAGVSPMSQLLQRRQFMNILKLINRRSSSAAGLIQASDFKSKLSVSYDHRRTYSSNSKAKIVPGQKGHLTIGQDLGRVRVSGLPDKGQEIRRHDSTCARRTDLKYEDVQSLLLTGSLQLIDVREPKELIQQGEFPTALNIPLSCLKQTLLLNEEHFKEQFNISKPQPRDKDIVFVGFGPVKSSTALEIAHKMGFKNARQYPGGFQEWMEKTAEEN